MLLSRGAYYSPQCSMVWQVVKSSLIWKSAILTWNRKDKLSLAPEIWYHFLKKASPSSTALHHSWAGVLVSPSGRLWIPLLGDRLPQWCGQLLCSPPNLSFHRALPLISKSPLARRWGQFRPRPHVWDGVGTCSSAAHQFSFPFPILAVCTVEGVGTSWILWNYLRIEIWYQPCTENSALHSSFIAYFCFSVSDANLYCVFNFPFPEEVQSAQQCRNMLSLTAWWWDSWLHTRLMNFSSGEENPSTILFYGTPLCTKYFYIHLSPFISTVILQGKWSYPHFTDKGN